MIINGKLVAFSYLYLEKKSFFKTNIDLVVHIRNTVIPVKSEITQNSTTFSEF